LAAVELVAAIRDQDVVLNPHPYAKQLLQGFRSRQVAILLRAQEEESQLWKALFEFLLHDCF